MKFPNNKFIVLTSLALLFSCAKLELIKVNKLSTGSASEITISAVTLEGNIIEIGDSGIDQHGFYLSTGSDPTTGDYDKTEHGPSTRTGVFSEIMTELDHGTMYYYRAYAKNTEGEIYGEVKSFQTLAAALPEVTSVAVTGITQTTAETGGNVTFDGGSAVTAHGVVWSTSENPTLEDNKTTDGTGTGQFASSLSGLSCGTTYYVRAYATNAVGTNYGEPFSFKTSECSTELPTVTTTAISSISQISAVGGGTVADDGGSEVTSRGVCWSTSMNPTISNSRSTDGNGTGEYTSSLSGLSCGTAYYVRAYASNANGTSYGNEVTFITGDCTSLPPTLTTSAVTNITETAAQSGGNVSDDGGSEVTVKGVCWSTAANPTISDSKTIDGNGTGGYTSAITDLTCGTTYYVRAYATNASGTSYGEEVSFSTTACPTGLPVVTTTAISNIQENSAQGGGNVSDDGGSPVTAKGVVWSTSQNPTTADNSSSDGSGTGGFTSVISSLSCGTTYYVRAYATNSNGTSYGDQEFFTTSDCPAALATVTTVAVSNITASSAQSGGTVTDDGGATVTAKGVCYSTSPNPSLSDIATTDGNGTGGYTSLLSGLDCGTTYYVRAYATNSAGTAYGSEYQFTTSSCTDIPTVTTTAISNIGINSASGGGNVTSDNGSWVTDKGVCWSTTSNPTLSDNFTNDGSGPGAFTSALTGLSDYTTYYVRAYATNSAGTAYGNQVSFKTSTVIDYDGNVYRTVVIGSQTWMAENLRTTRYSDGSAIPYLNTDSDWGNLGITDAAYSYFNNTSMNAVPYGALYTWPAVMNGESSGSGNPSGVQGVCPSGWHVPSDDEWIQLEVYLGMNQSEAESTGESRGTIGGKLRETGTAHWLDPNIAATNESGFTAVGSGYRKPDDGDSWLQYKISMFWTSTARSSDDAWVRYIHYNSTGISRYSDTRDFGLTVRCVKD